MWVTQTDDVEKAVSEALKKLQLEYLDVFYIHWPVNYFTTKTPTHVVWANLEKEVDKGRIRGIGISNFNMQLIFDVLCYAKHKPVVNQIELHPYLTQADALKFHLDFGILPISYCPLARTKPPTAEKDERDGKLPSLLLEPFIIELAEKYGKKES